MNNAWQSAPFQQLWQAKNAGRLPHALLFTGMKGTHKSKCADAFARALLCDHVSEDGLACQQCHACRLMEGRVHPNILWVEPEKAGAAIKVDQIRAINEFVQQSSLQGEYRIVILHPADNMNINAANALLKTLEEPASGALLILISDQNSQLPATILSRCQRVIFPQPNHEVTTAWMNAQPSREALFQALMQIATGTSDPVKSAAALQSHDIIQVLDFGLTWVVDLIRLQLSGGHEGLINRDYLHQLSELTQKTCRQNNLKLMEYLQQLRSKISDGANLNKQLLLESVLILWMESV